MKVTINLPKETMLRLAMDAHEEGVTLEALLQRMLYRHSMEMNDEPNTELQALDAVPDADAKRAASDKA